MKITTGEIEEYLPKDRKGKVSGGGTRAASMTPEQRKELARTGAAARWG